MTDELVKHGASDPPIWPLCFVVMVVEGVLSWLDFDLYLVVIGGFISIFSSGAAAFAVERRLVLCDVENPIRHALFSRSAKETTDLIGDGMEKQTPR